MSIGFKYFTTLTILAFLSGTTHAKLKEFETTRMMQMSGAGVGSLLVNEATVLNPAGLVFVPSSTLYYQKDSTVINEKDSSRSDYKDGRNEFLSFSDASTPLKGGFSYLYQNENDGKRSRYSLSSAGAVTKSTSLGFIYKYTDETSEIIDNSYHQMTFGLTHIYSENLYMGLIVVDPQNKISEYSYYALGLHYVLNQFIHLIGDIGSGDIANPDKAGFTKYAIQINSFEYFFFRVGKFHDNFNNRRGFSYGISWVGPRFSIDWAYKSSEIISQKSDRLLTGEEQVETSLSIGALF